MELQVPFLSGLTRIKKYGEIKHRLGMKKRFWERFILSGCVKLNVFYTKLEGQNHSFVTEYASMRRA